MKKGKFIVIEGLDGCGKSTISKGIAEFNNAKLLNALPLEIKSWLSVIGETKLPEVSFSYFTLCNLLKAKEIEMLISKGVNVVLDRYFYTTYVYHKEILKDVPDNIKSVYKDLLKPDLVVFLDVPQAERSRRIEKREGELQWYGDAISLKVDMTNSYYSFFEELNVNLLKVDNHNNSPEESITIINKAFEEL